MRFHVKCERSGGVSSQPSAGGVYSRIKDSTVQIIIHSPTLEAGWNKDQSKKINLTDMQET